MSRRYPVITIDTSNPDPTAAINAFLWAMVRARELGMTPATEYTLAEHLFRRDARVIFYSSMKGIMSLVADDDVLGDDGDLEFLRWITERKREHLHQRREKAAAAVGEIAKVFADPVLVDAEQSERTGA